MLSQVAEDALGAEAHDRAHHPARGSHWSPVPMPAQIARVSAHGHESPTLRTLRRFKAQVDQLVQQPHASGLCRAVQRSVCKLRQLLPDVPFVQLDAPAAAAEWASQACEQLACQEKQAKIQAWKRQVRDDEARARAWVRRKACEALEAEQEAPGLSVLPRAVHPANVVVQQAQKWMDKWTASHSAGADHALLRQVLNAVPQGACSDMQIQLSVEDLLKAARSMKKKMAGPDWWTTDLLLKLPLQWWEAATKLWMAVLHTSHVPESWQKSWILLLHKKVNETRPIGISPVIWRIGAKALNGKLLPWLTSFLDHRALGSAPGRSTSDVHARLLLAAERGCNTFVQQDLSSFFDSLDHGAMRTTLERLGAPRSFVGLVSAFYSCSRRIFRVGPYFTSEWQTATQGCLQGCPLSPTIALCFGYVWARYCASPQVDCAIYVDDRVLWPRSSVQDAPGEELAGALARSDTVDRAYGLACRPEKCALVAPPDDDRLRTLWERGYPRTQLLQVLGVSLDVCSQNASLLKLSLQKIRMRLRYLRLLNPSIECKKRIINSLITPTFTWAGGVAQPSKDELKSVKTAIATALSNSVTFEAPWVLLCAVHGWEWDPEWSLAWSALQAAARFHCRPPAWLDTAPLEEALAPWPVVLPRAAQAVRECGWQIVQQGAVIQKRDDSGRLRFFHFGRDNPKVLKMWLIERFKWVGVLNCNRVATSLHRPDPSLARGLNLPPPAHNVHFALAGHRQLGRQGPLNVRRAAVATGGSGWHVAKKIPERRAPLTCACGLEAPSRPHLTWNCDALTPLAVLAQLPDTRAGERLFAAEVPDYPPAMGQEPRSVQAPALATHLDEAFEHLVRIQAEEHGLLLATDGSSKCDVGASAVVTCDAVFTTSDDSEDQSAFTCELKALQLLSCALLQLTSFSRRRLFVLSDCQSALAAVARPTHCTLPLLAAEVARNFASVRALGLEIEFAWIPSHGKQTTWRPPGEWSVTAQACRLLNQKADEAADRAREAHAAVCTRPQWWRRWEAAKKWEEKAILASAASAGALETFFRQGVSRAAEDAGEAFSALDNL